MWDSGDSRKLCDWKAPLGNLRQMHAGSMGDETMIAAQQDLNFEEERRRLALSMDTVRRILLERWIANHELSDAVFALVHERFNEGGLSARVRDLKKPKFGAFPVIKRRVPGKPYYEYRIAV